MGLMINPYFHCEVSDVQRVIEQKEKYFFPLKGKQEKSFFCILGSAFFF